MPSNEHPLKKHNNLTALRWLAAGLVLYGHSFIFLGLPEPIFMNWVPLGALGVYIFFVISGYLVSQSWQNDPNVFRFLQRRALRIFPGVFVCTLLSVAVLGPLLTTLDFKTYWTHPRTWGYFSNVYLYITYNLPGVFELNRLPHAVNGSLWSLPVEFAMYLLLAVVGLLRFNAWGIASLALVLGLLNIYWALPATEMLVFYRTDVRQVVLCGIYFFMGAAFYRFNIQRWFSLSNVVLALILWLFFSAQRHHFIVAAWAVLPFVVLAFGLAQHALLAKLTPHDYSYGIYIYAFPVQQSVVSIWPNMALLPYLAMVSGITLILAAASWRFIEKPALAFKPQSPHR